MIILSRREFLTATASASLGTSLATSFAHAKEKKSPRTLSLSFGTYGMKTLTTEKAVEVLAKIGYDAIEIIARPDWDAEPKRMTLARRKDVRVRLQETGLQLTALMEHLQPSAEKPQQAGALDRLQRVAELGHDLSPQSQPLIQTTLGGGKWDEQRNLYRDVLGKWIEIGQRNKTVIAIKPHRGGGMSRPEEAVWLIEQLGKSPWLRMVYDYSHYAFRDMSVEETVETALPWIAHVAVKDTVKQGEKTAFVLPGESGKFDYAKLLKLLYAGGYHGDISCEVSGMVWNKPGYDPVVAARTCYRNMTAAFKKAGLRRG
jgi:sugar phosphate isomerase/epimerase